MKKFLLFVMLIPLMGMAQKNVLNATRVFPKMDRVLEFEKALMTHAKKYHKGDWSWRVYDIQSGPDAGGYHITEGPASWESLDARGNLGTEHNTDWNKSVAIYLTDRGSSSYFDYNDSLSTVKLSDWADKILINHMYPKPGMIGNVMELASKLKKVWVEGNESVAVYQANNSGAPQIITATRLKNGLKELAAGYRKPLPERYSAVNGDGSWDRFLQDYAKCVESRWSEILAYRADLSSK
ncbi:hypothetical protein SAMN05518672_105124 [Chitinophaga sp. CF118]|uniref:hypothetical protein n=1 Tax=Chitinophaga sp. CF118 TaxID=1884367 RepID=UPI0008E5B8CD|nr:hypothetical protein [Chitinophaga sp. CF118]SFE27319.1 hypothetical protein SAMN05518672_105124 [Chitinophaga sp. CF118]